MATQQQPQQLQQQSQATPSISTTGVPSAEYLRSRASALTRIMLTAFEDILSVGHDDTNGNDPTTNDDPQDTDPTTATADAFDQSLLNTAARQVAVDVATAKLVRAAEEYMVLTRTMKELWLFGGLDTLVTDSDNGDADRQGRGQGLVGKEMRARMQEDERGVVEGLQSWLGRVGGRLAGEMKEEEEGEEKGGANGTPMSMG